MSVRGSLEQVIKTEALRLGFELVGITTPDPGGDHYRVYERWLEAGRHGEMDYLASPRARECRRNPRQILPECQSIVVLGARYGGSPWTEESPRAEGLGATDYHFEPETPGVVGATVLAPGRVAAYAWGDDYHHVLLPRMNSLAEYIQAQTGLEIPFRVYTDSGPLLERDLAQRAGLGWIGKNSCLITPGAGSYFLLGELLLGYELEPDPPFTADRCGTCMRCIEACPTGCILPDRTLDARRCLSYLTIELKGPIPPDLRSYLGNWVFGCDICQQVCPWNGRFGSKPRVEYFPNPLGRVGLRAQLRSHPEFSRPDLTLEMGLSAEEFTHKFKGSPVKRAKRRGYLRNVAVALGNRGGQEAVLALGRALSADQEPHVRGHAAWALGQIGGEIARQFLARAQEVENEANVQKEIEAALAGDRAHWE